MRPIQYIRQFLRLSPDSSIHPQVRTHFRKNFINNTLDASFWLLGESFVSVNTILPVFASKLTDSAVLIGLVPSLIHAGWFIPQILLAGYVRRLPQKMPFARTMGLVERIPFLVLPLTAFLLRWVSPAAAIWLFMSMVAFRGFASGMVALPWQEVIATVIPSSVRSRFFGISRTLGRILAVIGSAFAGFILANFSYPDNYALSFLVGAIFIFLSYVFFTRTVEPINEEEAINEDIATKKHPLFDFPAFKNILKDDGNFRKYLISRISFQLGSMAIGFLAVYGIKQFSLPDEQAAVFSGILFSSGILGFFFWGVIGDRVGPRRVLLISDGMHIISLSLALISTTIWTYYLVFFIFGFAQSGYIIGELILGMELGTEKDRPIYLGLARGVPGVFILIAPLIGGTLVTLVGYQIMFLTAIAFSAVGVVFLYQVRERQKGFNY